MKTILEKIKNNKSTLILFIISSILLAPVHIGMFLAVGMSTDSGMNELSVYVIRDLLCLIYIVFLPFIGFIIFGQFIPLLIIICPKDKKFNIKFYTILLLVQSAPYSLLLFGIHSNFSLDCRQERILEIKRDKGQIVEGMLIYDLCNRYLNLDDISDVKDMAKQDKLIYSYEYKYISEYLDFVEYQSEEESLSKVLKIYKQESPEDNYIVFDKSIFDYLDMIDKFINEDLTIQDVHNDINEFLKRNIKYNPGDGRTNIDDMNYSLPIIITYENMRILNVLNEFTDDEFDKMRVQQILRDSLGRVKNYVDTKSYYYQYGKEVQLKDSNLYKKYCDIVDNLIIMSYANTEIIKESLGWINEDFELDLENPKLLELQILM